jgi:hypothetical protein
MRLTMKEKQAVIQVMQARYQKARKKLKQQILNECCLLTGYNRSYASHLLCQSQAPRARKKTGPRGAAVRPARRRYYDEKVQQALTRIWLILDCICGKRLQPILPELVPLLEKHGELKLEAETRQKLLELSSATIDRLLAHARKTLTPSARAQTKPGTLLKRQIPIRTFAEWNEAQPGFVEIDLVAHDGGQARGEYLYTLDVTDVCTGWTETQAVGNKGQVAVCEALVAIRQRLPFRLQGIDSDNGSEFINDHLLRYCQREAITFTRARSYRKNDNCFVEQKNYSVVRRNVGYLRHETAQEGALLNELYRYLRLYTNYFQPVLKLVSKERDGARVRKKYDVAQTPYRRVLAAAQGQKKMQAQLQREYDSLNPAALKRQITRLQNELLDVALARRAEATKAGAEQPGRGRKKTSSPPAQHPWRKAWSHKAKVELSKV